MPARHARVPADRLHALSPHAATDYRLSVPRREQPVLQGVFDTLTLPSGLTVHRVDARELQGSEVHAVLKEGLRIALVVGGRAQVGFGNLSLHLGPGARPGEPVLGAMVSVARPERFYRRGMRGAVERTVSISVPYTWLDAWLPLDARGQAIRAHAHTHLAVKTWPLSAQALALAEQLLVPAPVVPALWNLYVESRVLGLLSEAFGCWDRSQAPAPEASARLRPRDLQRMAQLRDWLDSGQADGLGLAEIAMHACMSVNTLQRHFRAAWGRTVVDYLRDARLERARAALERGGLSVTQAAWDAGYSSPANFATAFRRRYGLAPGQVRAGA
ncbi:AraC family transcriptional regulator [Orrella sp. JC864]|uniref:helix-turn-helix transcriptional regulator n=1 Tax=Orrella sp. JC864 TaxID=3120298 RepID=UPI0030083192